MERRTVLASGSSGMISVMSGCISSFFGCPDPDIESPLSYGNHRVENDAVYIGENVVELITESDNISSTLEEALDEDAIEYINRTNFDESSIIIVQVESSIDSDEIEVLGVGRENESIIRTYTCVSSESGTDDWYPRTQVIRVEHEGQIPERAIGTHYREDSEVTIED